MYLIGALKASEGKEWCGYKSLLPTAMQEEIYIGFKYKEIDQAQPAAELALSFWYLGTKAEKIWQLSLVKNLTSQSTRT